MLPSVFKGRNASGGTLWNECTSDPEVVPQQCKCYDIYKVCFHILKLLMQWLLVLKYHYDISIWMLKDKVFQFIPLLYNSYGFFSQKMLHKKHRDHVDLFIVDLLVGMFQAFRIHQKLIQHKLLLIFTFKSWFSVLWVIACDCNIREHPAVTSLSARHCWTF